MNSRSLSIRNDCFVEILSNVSCSIHLIGCKRARNRKHIELTVIRSMNCTLVFSQTLPQSNFQRSMLLWAYTNVIFFYFCYVTFSLRSNHSIGIWSSIHEMWKALLVECLKFRKTHFKIDIIEWLVIGWRKCIA